jgi:hypothetical protein
MQRRKRTYLRLVILFAVQCTLYFPMRGLDVAAACGFKKAELLVHGKNGRIHGAWK